jgi:hypothetical protein
MADYAQILLLPPPQPPQQRLPARESDLAVNGDAQQQGGDSARARRFRFRVYEGSDSSETNVDYASRRTSARAALTSNASANPATTEQPAQSFRYSGGESGSSSAFLAQTFAQEQLGEGLHNPPFAAASAAYSRAGAALDPRASAGLDIHA